MIKIKPIIDHKSTCPHCNGMLQPHRLLWQGIHVCAVSVCIQCAAEIIDDLPIGQARFTPCQFDRKTNKLFQKKQEALVWFGIPFADSLKNPVNDVRLSINIEKFNIREKVIILNCIDYLYGHSLLKLLNAGAHLRRNPEYGLVLIIPSFLRWMAPECVAEIWSVDIPLSRGRNYYPDLDMHIQKECERFDEIYISRAHSHPAFFDITTFTRVRKHDFKRDQFRITFVWRDDRPWLKGSLFFSHALKKIYAHALFLYLQRNKVKRLFNKLRKQFPFAIFTIAGMSKTWSFPRWIDDQRIERFDEAAERNMCKIYSESRLVIGVHGSNMLLPSAHAGLTIDLMPDDRWGNFAQDILYQEQDARLSSYRYRYYPLQIKTALLSRIATQQIREYPIYRDMMLEELKETS